MSSKTKVKTSGENWNTIIHESDLSIGALVQTYKIEHKYPGYLQFGLSTADKLWNGRYIEIDLPTLSASHTRGYEFWGVTGSGEFDLAETSLKIAGSATFKSATLEVDTKLKSEYEGEKLLAKRCWKMPGNASGRSRGLRMCAFMTCATQSGHLPLRLGATHS